jgi:hypothetical protein
MAGRSDEEQACMDTEVALLRSFWLLFLPHVYFVLVVNKINNGGPRVAVVNVVPKTRGVNHGQLDFERLLLEFSLDYVDLLGGTTTVDEYSGKHIQKGTRTSVSLSSCLTWRRE